MKRLIAFAISLILVFGFITPAYAAEFPDLQVALNADNDTVYVGDELKVTLSFENASEYPYGLAAFCSMLRYDSNVLKVSSITAAAPRSSIRHNSMSGELRSVYTFADAQKKPGFNVDGAFYTVTFKAVSAGSTDISVTFDAVTVTDYDSEQLNFKVAFNSPKISVKVNGPAIEIPSDAPSADTPSANAPSSTTPSKKPTNDKFQDVADGDQDTVKDVFDDQGEIIEQTESEAPKKDTSSNVISADKDEVDTSETNGVPNLLIWVAIGVAALIVVAVVVVIVVKKSKK